VHAVALLKVQMCGAGRGKLRLAGFRPMPLELHDPEDLDSESGHRPALDFTRRMATGVSRGRGSRAAAPSGGP
jgi:hypothetical protein